jgi:hypothetical protein
MAKASYLFPGASMSPDSGPFPFFIWSLADLNGTANQSMIYAPSLFAGVTENTAWDGNNYDFYFGETGNRVFLLLQQHYSHSISLWSCAAGTCQGDTANQMLAEFPLPSMDTLAGSATRIEFAGEKVRVRVGADPLVSAGTDADGWVSWNFPNGATWHWDSVRNGTAGGTDPVVHFALKAGSYTLEIAYREDGARLDAIVITDAAD